MSTGRGCPDPARLAEHAQDALPPADATVFDRHLAECRRCLHHFLELGKRSLAPEIPHCYIRKEIGRGASGVVYKAWWLKGEPRIVALKVVSCAGDMEKDRFDREIAVLQRIDSPGIVKCLDSGASGDARYYVMDFVEGVHLDKYLASCHGGLSEKLAVFERVCRAVADAHATGVVHRDLKPRNILIDADGRPHILDFGICTVDTADWSSWARCTITQPGAVIGTLKYMSPQQAWGGVAGPIDERSDLWALGVMLYEIVTGGSHPYSLKSTPDKPATEALLERIRRELPRLVHLRHLPRGRDLEVLLERCLAWEPERRIESAAHLADDLQRYGAGRRIKTKQLRLPYRLKRLAVGAATRSRWPFAACFVAMLGMSLYLATYLFNVGWHVTGGWPSLKGGWPSLTDMGEATSELNASSASKAPARTEPTFIVSPTSKEVGHPTKEVGQRASDGWPMALAVGDAAREGMLMVGVYDDTVDAVVDFAAREGITGVEAGMKSWRAVHGRLMERLAAAGPRGVVWDYFFRTPQPGDADFVAGVKALEEAGVPVILAASSYDDNGEPDLSPHIVRPLGRQLRHGAIAARDMVQRPGGFVMAVRRAEGAAVPSLALSTFAALRHPRAQLDLDWPGQNGWINLLYEIQPQAYLRERDRIKFTTIKFTTLFKEARGLPGIRAGDLLACTTFPLEEPEVWAARTVPYQTLLLGPFDELRALVRDKLIIIGDFRAPRFGAARDRHRVKYGTSIVNDVPGCYLLADAVAGLLDGRYMTSAFPPTPMTFLGILLLGTVGCLMPIKLATNRIVERLRFRHILWIGLIGLAATAFLGMVLSESYTGVHLSMAGFALTTPMIGAFWVEFARNRHRIADKKRRAIETFGVGTSRTITLASRRRRSLTAAR